MRAGDDELPGMDQIPTLDAKMQVFALRAFPRKTKPFSTQASRFGLGVARITTISACSWACDNPPLRSGWLSKSRTRMTASFCNMVASKIAFRLVA